MPILVDVRICQINQQFPVQIFFSGSVQSFERVDALYTVEYSFTESGSIGKSAVRSPLTISFCLVCSFLIGGITRPHHDFVTEFGQFRGDGVSHIACSQYSVFHTFISYCQG